MINHKILLIIGFAFPMYGYAYLFKEYFDLCNDVFIMSLLFIIMDFVVKYTKDLSYKLILSVMMLSVLYAIIKEILHLGTTYVWSDTVMWFLIPFALISILIIDLIKALKNESK